MYVVHYTGTDDPRPLRAFESRSQANAFADQQVCRDDVEKADIYEVDTLNPYAARAAVEMSEARLLETRSRRSSSAEIDRDVHLKSLQPLKKEDLWGPEDA